MAIQILPAIPEDSAALTELAFTAKAHWGYPSEWLESWREEIAVKPEDVLVNRIHKAVNGDGRILGFYGLSGVPPTLTLAGMWVHPDAMGNGIGKALYQHAVRAARLAGAESVEWESDPQAAGFYRRMGATEIGVKEYALEGALRRLPMFRQTLRVAT